MINLVYYERERETEQKQEERKEKKKELLAPPTCIAIRSYHDLLRRLDDANSELPLFSLLDKPGILQSRIIPTLIGPRCCARLIWVRDEEPSSPKPAHGIRPLVDAASSS